MSAETTSAAEAPSRSYAGFLKNNIREYGMLISLIVIMLYFQFATDGRLFQPDNLTNIVQQRGYIVVMALGMLMIIVAGHIDLSVGWLCGFLGAVAAILMVDHGVPWYLAVLATLVFGGMVGAVQGYAVAYLHIPSFIVTLAGMLIFRGLTLYVLGGRNVGPFPPELATLLTGFFPDLTGRMPDPIAPHLETLRLFVAPYALAAVEAWNRLTESAALLPKIEWAPVLTRQETTGDISATSLGIATVVVAMMLANAFAARVKLVRQDMQTEPFVFFLLKTLAIAGMLFYLAYLFSTYRGLPNVFVIMGLLIALYSFVTTRTTVGRRLYALGGNEKAAKLSGINTERLVFLAFVNMGVLSALAGMMFATRLGWATPKSGDGFELDVIAACFIGGASASGGVGTVLGAVIGAFIMGVMNNGMSMMGIGIDWQFIIKGSVLFLAVFLDVYNKKKG
ncbi:multiple monosaccharide ABC transporter permease [Prosthecodimorpha staleyi]|uniref:Xylose transport system permease protein XylH n=1 Tax=Prosthecodimorpha staleyi TaxID=2840188 RepID=A0A947D6H6_9HYPH|nr:multiple monosaccharide ABC transporter permease [Prosthecodimorpha staleyi]MBT9289012.1 sugar ABC transporter permease [Prosthecodimorpha staleyi]